MWLGQSGSWVVATCISNGSEHKGYPTECSSVGREDEHLPVQNRLMRRCKCIWTHRRYMKGGENLPKDRKDQLILLYRLLYSSRISSIISFVMTLNNIGLRESPSLMLLLIGIFSLNSTVFVLIFVNLSMQAIYRQ